MTTHRASEAGFTLVELLVALAIFALMSVAGVTLLRSGGDTQLAVERTEYPCSRTIAKAAMLKIASATMISSKVKPLA